jgi:hypothetical protein
VRDLPPPLPFTTIIHENLAVVLTYAYSYKALRNDLLSKFEGEFKFLWKTVDDVATERATRAFVELATLLRLLHDRQKISDYLRQTSGHNFGRVIKDDPPDEPLYLRDLTNKIVHAADYMWDFENIPKFVCISGDPKRWTAAEIDIERLAAFCGQLMH